MVGEYIRIKVGMLLKVERSFWTSGEHTENGIPVKRYIKKGSIIEIRYPYAWHFRTEQNIYDHVKEETLRRRCSFFGQIHEEIRFGNKHKTKDILINKLYHTPDEYTLRLKTNQTER